MVEVTIREIHNAMQSGKLTSRELVDCYLRRIEEYDQSTGLNSIVLVNPNALSRAEDLDDEYRRTGILRPLHGIPMIVKDNYDTHDLQTSAGSIALKGSLPPNDAYQVRAIREAGAIVLAKSNMAEWAFSPYETVSSIAGTTRNPYDLERVPAGSSGGTAAAVAASFGVVGLGTDTGNSIRGPSSHCCLVGIRSTMGLTSRDGIVPLHLRNDVGGPMARCVEDTVRVLEVIAGHDPADPITERSIGKVPDGYLQFLDEDGLKGAKIGVFRYYTDQPTADSEVKALFEEAIDDLNACGAEIVDPFEIEDFEQISEKLSFETFREDLGAYLASLGEKTPYKSLKEIFDSGKYSPHLKKRIKRSLDAEEVQCEDIYSEPRNVAFREAVVEAINSSGVDAFVYPTWSNPPRVIGDMESPAGDNSQKIPPHTGLPGITVPMGFTYRRLPAGLQIVSRLFSEPTLLRIAYAYEQATGHRRPPELYAK